MPFRRLTPMQEIQDYLHEQVKRRERAIIYNLSAIGESCINAARTNGSYTDQTGNLRSSIGYTIVQDGRIIQQSSFQQVKHGTQGTKDGESFARQIVSKFPEGICLIVVAGMNYAAYVSAKGYNVLDSSEDLAERLVPQIMKQIGFTVK